MQGKSHYTKNNTVSEQIHVEDNVCNNFEDEESEYDEEYDDEQDN